MNTHDKIVKCRSCGYVGPCDPTCCERPDYDGATAEEAWQAAIYAVSQPDETSKGETVLYTSQEALDLISRSDAVVSVGLTRVPQMSWNVPLYTAPQPAEPTPAQIRRSKLRADPIKAAALDRARERIAAELANSAELVKVPSDSAIMFEWSQTPNTGDMRVDLIAFARALLARYGNTQQEQP